MDALIGWLLGAAAFVFATLTGALGWALKVNRDGVLKDVEYLKKEAREIRENYVSRFEGLQSSVTNGNQALMNKISGVELSIARTSATREDIAIIHRRLDGLSDKHTSTD
jgi:hypothetical protein